MSLHPTEEGSSTCKLTPATGRAFGAAEQLIAEDSELRSQLGLEEGHRTKPVSLYWSPEFPTHHKNDS